MRVNVDVSACLSAASPGSVLGFLSHPHLCQELLSFLWVPVSQSWLCPARCKPMHSKVSCAQLQLASRYLLSSELGMTALSEGCCLIHGLIKNSSAACFIYTALPLTLFSFCYVYAVVGERRADLGCRTSLLSFPSCAADHLGICPFCVLMGNRILTNKSEGTCLCPFLHWSALACSSKRSNANRLRQGSEGWRWPWLRGTAGVTYVFAFPEVGQKWT